MSDDNGLIHPRTGRAPSTGAAREKSHLLSATITNASGVTTTVRRKPAQQSSKPKAAKALITEAAVNLGISKAMGKRLGQKSDELPADAQTAMLNLMGQPDPHGTVSTLLIEKFGKRHAALWPDGTDPYKTPDMERFAAWLFHAEHHLHAVDAFCRDISDSEYSYPHVTTNRTLSGLQAHTQHGFNVDQYRDVALVTAAVSTRRVEHLTKEHDLTTLNPLAAEEGEHLSSGIVRDLITSDHEKAVEALRLITDEIVLTEAELMHRLEGIPRGLTSGVI